MDNVKIYEHTSELAEAAAKKAVDILKHAIDKYGQAVWMVAGGSTPKLAYEAVVAKHAKDLDWSKVTLVLGDERIGPTDGPDSNWRTIDGILGSLPTKKLVPNSDQTAEDAAKDYERQLASLPMAEAGLPRFDLAWLGIGSDGHTLSLFPMNVGLLPTGGLVSPVHDSPKPPSDRITLTLRALIGTERAMVLATGKDKRRAVREATAGGGSPIALAAGVITTHGGTVTWYVDHDAVTD